MTIPLFTGSSGPERVFLGWDRPALPTAAALLAERYSRAGALDLGAATLVLPGGRAGRRLEELLLDEAEARGLRLVPPRVTTVGQLPELLFEPDLPPAGEMLARRLWVRALRGLLPEQRERVFPTLPEDDDLRGWTTLAQTVERLHREVGSAGMRFRDVVACCADGLLFDDAERWTALAAAQNGYEAGLAALGHADRDLARIDALARGELRVDTDVWLVGVAEMPGIARQMLVALSAATDRVRVLAHAPASESEALDALGCVRPEAWLQRGIPLDDARLCVRGRPAEQAEEVARTLAGLGGRYAADEIVVAVPDRELESRIEQRLAEAGVPTHPAEGTPLGQTPPYRLLGAVADYLDGRRFAACAALLRHPDVGPWLRRAASDAGHEGLHGEDRWLESLDAFFGEHLSGTLCRFPAGADSREAATVRAICRALDDDRLLGRFRGERPLAAWSREVLDLLIDTYGARPLDRAHPAQRRLLDALGAIGEVAAEAHRLPESVDEPCDAPTAIRLLLDACRDAVIAPPADRAAVELLGWLEMHLDDTPVAVITSFNEPFLPESVNADAFLPNALRTRLGLVDNDRRYARDAYQLTAMLASREVTRVIAGRRSAAGDPLRPSRLMFAVGGDALAARVQRFYGEQGDPVPPPAPAAPGGASVSRFRLPPEPELSLDRPVEAIAVTAFRTLLRDPYRFALDRVLGYGVADDSARELDGLAFGTLAHEVLRRFGGSPAARSPDGASVRRALEVILADEADRRFGDVAHPAVRIQVEQLRARLGAFAAWQARRVEQGWTTVDVECDVSGGGVPFDVDGTPILLRGRIDRIDHHPALGLWAVFDYKTGDMAQAPDDTHRVGRGDKRRWVDLQLPLYRHLLPRLQHADGTALFTGAMTQVDFGYILLPRELDQTGDRMAGWTDDELADADEAAREAVRMLRVNRFRFDEAAGGGFDGDSISALLGRGQLQSVVGAEDTE